jgi:phosphatidylinositol alpha-1,6-mannosyltransferase
MERLNYQAFLALQKAYSVAVCGPQGAAAFLAESTPFSEVALAPLSRFLLSCQWESLKLACRLRPQIIYSGSGVTAPAALMAARAIGGRAVCFLHGLDIVADHPVYRRIFLPAIRRVDRIIVNSRHTAGLAQAAGVSADKINIINPGVELPAWHVRAKARQRFRDRLGLGVRPVLLAAGRLTQRKGLAEFISNALPEICRQVPDVLLLVIGSEATSALKHRDGIEDGIRVAIHESGLSSHINMLGSVGDECLSDAYFASDAMVFPVLDLPGDVEGFGMVAVEAAAHGLPTVAFAVGGVPDAVANGKSGWLVPSGDYGAFIRRTLALLTLPEKAKGAEVCRCHAERFEWAEFGRRLNEAIHFD